MIKDFVFSLPWVYSLWQMPFNKQKFQPVMHYEHLWRDSGVLDIGCGPGTNTSFFGSAKFYMGIDFNNSYITNARKIFPKHTFLCSDVTQLGREQFEVFSGQHEVIFCGSLLHHLSDNQVHMMFNSLLDSGMKGKHLLLVDLLLPEQENIAHFLARQDRGHFARTHQEWRVLLEPFMEITEDKIFRISLMHLNLWELIFIKAKLRSK